MTWEKLSEIRVEQLVGLNGGIAMANFSKLAPDTILHRQMINTLRTHTL